MTLWMYSVAVADTGQRGIDLFDKTYLASPRISGTGLTAEHLSSVQPCGGTLIKLWLIRSGQVRAVIKGENAQRSGLNASNATAMNTALDNVRGLARHRDRSPSRID